MDGTFGRRREEMKHHDKQTTVMGKCKQERAIG